MTNTTMIDITPIIEAILGIIISIFTVVIAPKIYTWVTTKLASNKIKLTEGQINIIKIIVKSAVEAAEQIYINTKKSGSSKKKFAIEHIKTELAKIGLTFDEKEIEIYLEQAVKQMNKDNKMTTDMLDTIKPEGSM